MSRHIKSPTRTISNRGPLPRFIGYFPCSKNAAPWIPFDSIASLKVAIYLEWNSTVMSMAFEQEKVVFGVGADAQTVIPDYGITLDSGEVRHVEAKSDRNMSAKAEADLALKTQLFAEAGRGYDVIYRRDLEADGFIDTIAFLRRYAGLAFSSSRLNNAAVTLKQSAPLTLAEYRSAATAADISFSLLYHLLYHQRLPLRYVPFTHDELKLCHA